LLVIGAAITILVGLVSGKGIAPNEWRHKRDMQNPYPIAPSLAYRRANGKPGSEELQFNRLGAPALGIVLDVKADLCALVQLRNSGLLYGRNMDKNVLAAPVRSDKAISLGLIEKFYRAIPAHEKKAPTLFTVQPEYASRRVLQQGVCKSAVCHLIFVHPSHKLGRLSMRRLS
jgi:hypothetical protein